jgi:hypothetical protein
MSLKDPSNYWISVINVGRYFQLQRVREVDESNEYAGQVIAALMHVGDVLALAPASLACTAGSSLEAANKLAVAYIEETKVTEIGTPCVVAVEAVDSLLKPMHMMEGPANVDDDVFVLDNNMDVGRKMKRAFCGNKFSKVLYVVTLYGKCTRALTFEHLCQSLATFNTARPLPSRTHACSSWASRSQSTEKRKTVATKPTPPSRSCEQTLDLALSTPAT